MKTALLLLALTTSSQVFASYYEGMPLAVAISFDITRLPIALPQVTSNLSSGTHYKEANQVIRDASEYVNTGRITPFLNQAILSVQADNSELSVNESVDVLVDAAQNMLQDL